MPKNKRNTDTPPKQMPYEGDIQREIRSLKRTLFLLWFWIMVLDGCVLGLSFRINGIYEVLDAVTENLRLFSELADLGWKIDSMLFEILKTLVH